MPIADVDTTWREIGRIRTGQRDSDDTPQRLVTFRLTSASESAIRAAARTYGGTTRPWRSPSGPAWEVVTDTAELDVTIPPGAVFSQWWERWTAAGRERQCDGAYDRQGEVECRCPSDINARIAAARQQRACRPITRLAVILHRLPDLGVWRLEAHGLIAAKELGATMRAVTTATDQGAYVPGVLRLDQRRSRKPGEKPHDYGIPVLELPQLRAEDLLTGDADRAHQLALGAPWRRLEEAPLLDVADDVAEPGDEPTPEPPLPPDPPATQPGATAPPLVDWSPYPPDEAERHLVDLVTLAATHRRNEGEARRFLTAEAHREPEDWALVPRRTWTRVMLKFHAGDYDLTALERATVRAAQATAEQAARDPRSRQAVPDPAEVDA